MEGCSYCFYYVNSSTLISLGSFLVSHIGMNQYDSFIMIFCFNNILPIQRFEYSEKFATIAVSFSES